eukprot:NODE_12190_length_1240_cov_2.490566.p2 GENE.NODE_12190_length_1240_cov_2.490566~~NODE_12190_length_1240_cov_2.490566.p2  ORF type:complete len:194 (+),score=47.85 NODE_12190_length_1240_cov_2.490566:239-820(+)
MAASTDEPEMYDAVYRRGAGIGVILKREGPFDLALIMAGTNDLGRSPNARAVAREVEALHTACHAHGVRTLALSMPPNRLVGRDSGYTAKWRLLNSSLKTWASGSGRGLTQFVDTAKLVPYTDATEGLLWERDGLHLSPAGSRQLGERLAEYVRPLLGGAPAAQPTTAAATARRYTWLRRCRRRLRWQRAEAE